MWSKPPLQADHPAACSELLWYHLELTVKDAGEKGCIAIGFTDGLNFQSDMQPGWYPNSVGYHGDDGNLFVGHGSDAVYRGFGPTFTTGDVIGAGVYYGTDELFVKNGKTVGCTSASTVIEGCLLYPTVGLHSRGETVLLNFKEELFVKEVVPTCLHYPSYHLRQGRMLAVLADHCAPVRADFYFELTVSSRGLTIGFASLGEFIDSKQPGLYAQSCGYDGDEGACYAMSHTKFETRSVPEFGPGDTVGAGLDRYLNIIFFTHNGKAMQSVLPYSHVFETCLVYPTIAMARGVQSLNVNFGDRPFVWEG